MQSVVNLEKKLTLADIPLRTPGESTIRGTFFKRLKEPEKQDADTQKAELLKVARGDQ